MERELLTGLLALQNGFVAEPNLVQALADQIDGKGNFLDRLRVHAELTDDAFDQLQQMVGKYLERFESPEQALKSLSAVSRAREKLSELVDRTAPDMEAAVSWFSELSNQSHSPITTSSHSGIGDPLDRSDEPRFRIISKHAEGGLGVVYIAEDHQLRREVALKQIKSRQADEGLYRERFKQEAQITGQLEHPGIVPIYALGADDDGRPYYAMRFIQGESLRDRIRNFHQSDRSETGTFDGPELRALLRRFTDVCNAIAYAHQRGVLHRDLKPGNVMLGEFGETLVVDWGLAKTMTAVEDPAESEGNKRVSTLGSSSGSKTQQGQFLGTAAYAPPEQLEGRLIEFSQQTDVYSLGAILFEVLSGKPPIESATSIAQALEIINATQELNLNTAFPSVPKALLAIALKAMKPAQAERYQTANLLRDEVQRWLDDCTVEAYQEPLRERLFRWMRQHRSATSAAAVALLSGLVLLVTFLFFQNQRAGLVAEKSRAEASVRVKAAEARANEMKFLSEKAFSAEVAGNSVDAIVPLRNLRKLEGSLPVDQEIRLARNLFFNQQTEEAYELLTEMNTSHASELQLAERNLLLGDILYGTSRDAEGEDLLRKALSSNQLSPSSAFYAEGVLAPTPNEARDALERCLVVTPYHSFARVRLALTLCVLGETESAIELANAGSELHPNDWRFPWVRAFCYATMAQGDQVNFELAKIPDSEQRANVENAIRIVEVPFRLIDRRLSGRSSMGFQEVATEIQQSAILFKQLVPTNEYSKFSFAFPKLGWFGSFNHVLGDPQLNVPSLTVWVTKLYFGGEAKDVVNSLAELLPQHKLVQLIAAELTLQDSNPDLFAFHAAAARESQKSMASADTRLASLVIDTVANGESLNAQNSGRRGELRPLLAEWRVFLIDQASVSDSLPRVQLVHIWGVFLLNGFTSDALQIAEIAMENESLTEAEQREWQLRSDLTEEQLANTEMSPKEIKADPRYIIVSAAE